MRLTVAVAVLACSLMCVRAEPSDNPIKGMIEQSRMMQEELKKMKHPVHKATVTIRESGQIVQVPDDPARSDGRDSAESSLRRGGARRLAMN